MSYQTFSRYPSLPQLLIEQYKPIEYSRKKFWSLIPMDAAVYPEYINIELR